MKHFGWSMNITKDKDQNFNTDQYWWMIEYISCKNLAVWRGLKALPEELTPACHIGSI